MSLENCAKEERHLKSIQNELEYQLATLKTDHETVSVELENKSLHLNKTTVQLHNFESKCQVINLMTGALLIKSLLVSSNKATNFIESSGSVRYEMLSSQYIIESINDRKTKY